MSATLAPARSSATTLPTPAAHRTAQLRVTQLRVMRSEWTKFRSLRSTIYTLGVAVVLMTGLAALFSAITANQPGGFGPGESAWSTSQGSAAFAQLAIGVLGVLMISGEYSTGSIRSSLTAVPKRLPVLWAKVAVFAGVVFVTMLVASLGAFFAGQALLSRTGMGVSLSDPNALRAVVGAALYLTVVGVTGLAPGALFRNTAAAISTPAVSRPGTRPSRRRHRRREGVCQPAVPTVRHRQRLHRESTRVGSAGRTGRPQNSAGARRHRQAHASIPKPGQPGVLVRQP